MKVRSGFVSNSSSSSFVLEVGKPFNTALEVAKYMVPKRGYDDDSDLVKKIERTIQKCPNTPTPICFNSCNYDTFIVKMDRYFLIQTCHNHDWDLDQWRVSPPSEYYEYFGDDSFYNLEHSFDFLHLNFDCVGRPLEWRDSKDFDFCACHAHEFWRIGETILCPKCGKPPEKRKKNES